MQTIFGNVLNIDDGIFVEQVTYSNSFDRDYLRLAKLRRLRLLSGVICLSVLAWLCASVYQKVPYEPAAALLACTSGIFAVFYMKVRDLTLYMLSLRAASCETS